MWKRLRSATLLIILLLTTTTTTCGTLPQVVAGMEQATFVVS